MIAPPGGSILGSNPELDRPATGDVTAPTLDSTHPPKENALPRYRHPDVHSYHARARPLGDISGDEEGHTAREFTY
jgi:hypothetical protein